MLSAAQASDMLLPQVLSTSPNETLYRFEAIYTNDDEALTVRVDPSLPQGERVRVLSPSSEDHSDFVREKIAQLEEEPMPSFWCAEHAQMIPDDALQVDEDDSSVTYQFAPKPDPGDEEDVAFMSNIIASTVIDKTNPAILSFEMHAPKPFKPAMVAKIKSFEYSAMCRRAPDGQTYLQDLTVRIKGSAFFKSFEQRESREITRLTPIERTPK